jgi:hypothetical protein
VKGLLQGKTTDSYSLLCALCCQGTFFSIALIRSIAVIAVNYENFLEVRTWDKEEKHHVSDLPNPEICFIGTFFWS